jgi:hypothetical protein
MRDSQGSLSRRLNLLVQSRYWPEVFHRSAVNGRSCPPTDMTHRLCFSASWHLDQVHRRNRISRDLGIRSCGLDGTDQSW